LLFDRRAFRYDSEADVYYCPQGERLSVAVRVPAERTIRYQAPAAVCNACPLKSHCTTSAHGRHVYRSFDEAYLERVRTYYETEAYQKAMRKRKVWIEPLFGEAKDWHGLRRFRLRGLPKVNIEALLIASGQNIKRLLATRAWQGPTWTGGMAARRHLLPCSGW